MFLVFISYSVDGKVQDTKVVLSICLSSRQVEESYLHEDKDELKCNPNVVSSIEIGYLNSKDLRISIVLLTKDDCAYLQVEKERMELVLNDLRTNDRINASNLQRLELHQAHTHDYL